MALEEIKFGTDGWRSVISDGFTVANVRRVAQAVCSVLRESTRNRLILVGYDRRFFSDRFAMEAARVAVGNGFKVEMCSSPISSPTLSFNVKSRKAAIGFMITASHNPYTFNGFKLKGPHGGSVDETFTAKVEAAMDVKPVQVGEGDIKRVDFISDYVRALRKLVRPETLSKIKGPIAFDAMHGPGGDLLATYLNGAGSVIYVRKDADPLFGGGAPEPIERYLTPLKEVISSAKPAAGFAMDGDVDRIGVVDDKGRYLPPHTVMPLILLHLIEGRKMKGKVVQTVSMGYLPQRIAAHFNLPFEETPVGFKYIAAKMENEKVLFGGEESGGYGVGLWSPERDGLLCAMLLVEMMAERKAPLSVLVDELKSRFGESHFERIDFSLSRPVNKAEWTEAIKANMVQAIAGQAVKTVRADDGIKIVTETDAWVLMRPSGTEPLIRTYAEASSLAVAKDLLKEADRLVHLAPAKADSSKLNGSKKSKVAAKKRRAR